MWERKISKKRVIIEGARYSDLQEVAGEKMY
jgi:hypothetical protein